MARGGSGGDGGGGWGGGENERTSATGEGDRGRGATFHPGSPGVTGASRHQTSSAVTPSGDGRSLTRCILVISVSCAALGNTVGTAEKERGNNTRGEKKKRGGEGSRTGGRKEGERKRWPSVRGPFEKSGTCVCVEGRGVGRRGEKLG